MDIMNKYTKWITLLFLITSIVVGCSCDENDVDSPTAQVPAAPAATPAIETPSMDMPSIDIGGTDVAITTADIPTLNISDILDITMNEDSPASAMGPPDIIAGAGSFSLDLSTYASGETSGIIWDVIGVNPELLLITISESIANFVLVENAYGENIVTFHAQNSYGNSVTDNVKVTINPVDDIPIILGDEGVTITVNEDSTATYDLATHFDSPDGDELTYICNAATNDITIVIDGSIITITPNPDFYGDLGISCAASDGANSINSDMVVSVINVPDAPQITSNPTLTALDNSDYQYKIEVSDPDSSSFTYNVKQGPEGMSVTSDGYLRWSPLNRGGSTMDVAVEVTDDSGLSAIKTYNIYVNYNWG